MLNYHIYIHTYIYAQYIAFSKSVMTIKLPFKALKLNVQSEILQIKGPRIDDNT